MSRESTPTTRLRALDVETDPWGWWAEAPNPACVHGCQRRHDTGEFRWCGDFSCCLAVFSDTAGRRLVVVEAYQSAEPDEPGLVRQHPAEASVVAGVDGLGVAAARDIALALSRAAVLIAEAGR